MSAIAQSYWRLIKANRRTFESVPVEQKENVKTLAKSDVVNGVITEDDYADYIGEPYVA